MTNQDIKNDICTYITENILLEMTEELDCSKNLFTDYGLDSITIIELILYMEEKYGIEFDLFNVDFVELKSVDRMSLNIFYMVMKKESRVC